MNRISAHKLRDMFLGGARRLCENSREIDDLNVFPVPDGDTGKNMCDTLLKMEEELGGGFGTPAEAARAAARGALFGARGNSGVILSQLLKGFADGIEDGVRAVDAIMLANALVEAADSAYQAVIKPVEGTILTVIKEASTAAALSVSGPDTPPADVLDAALVQAKLTLARTPDMLEKLRQAGVVDAGGKGAAYFLEGMLLVLQGELEVGPARVREEREAAAPELEYRYCTEAVIAAPPEFARELKDELEGDSDSLIVVGGDGVVKLHVHTNNPGIVLSLAQQGGELVDIKVDNMGRQHRELSRYAAEGGQFDSDGEPGGLSVVAVVDGDGFREIFRSMGVESFVRGGQSMNPSTQEIVQAIQQAGSREVAVLPNNPNVTLAAGKAAEMVDKKVYVIPTRNIPQGFAAMIEFDHDGTPQQRVEKMTEAAGEVSVAEITRAVRDSSADGIEIHEGDFISILDGKIALSAGSVEEALEKTVGVMVENDCEIITVFGGQPAGDGWEKTVEKLEQAFPDIEFESHFGGQPNYDYIVSGE